MAAFDRLGMLSPCRGAPVWQVIRWIIVWQVLRFHPWIEVNQMAVRALHEMEALARVLHHVLRSGADGAAFASSAEQAHRGFEKFPRHLRTR